MKKKIVISILALLTAIFVIVIKLDMNLDNRYRSIELGQSISDVMVQIGKPKYRYPGDELPNFVTRHRQDGFILGYEPIINITGELYYLEFDTNKILTEKYHYTSP